MIKMKEVGRNFGFWNIIEDPERKMLRVESVRGPYWVEFPLDPDKPPVMTSKAGEESEIVLDGESYPVRTNTQNAEVYGPWITRFAQKPPHSGNEFIVIKKEDGLIFTFRKTEDRVYIRGGERRQIIAYINSDGVVEYRRY
jgi:hypothetical protein